MSPRPQLRQDRLLRLVERDRLGARLGELGLEFRRIERDQHVVPCDPLPFDELAGENTPLNLGGDAHLGRLQLAVGIEEASGHGLGAQEAVAESGRCGQCRCSCDPSPYACAHRFLAARAMG